MAAPNQTGGAQYDPSRPPKKRPGKRRPGNRTSGGEGTARPPKRKPEIGYRKGYNRRTTESSRERFMERYGRAKPPAKQRPAKRPAGGTGGSQAPAPAKPPGYGAMTPYQQAVADSNVRYGPALNEINRLRGATPGYFDQYRAQIQAANTLYNQQAAPIVAQAQQTQQTAGQVAPGTEQDPEAQLAAQSRAALTGLGLTTLNQMVGAQQGYFQGRAGPVAAAQQLSTQQDLDRERRETIAERGQYRVQRRGELRSQRHTERLENAAFGLNQYEAQTERQQSRREARQRRREERRDRREARRERRQEAGEVNQYGYSEKEWRAFTPEQRRKIMREVKAEQRPPEEGGGGGGGLTPTQLRARREKRGTAINKVREAGSLASEYSTTEVQPTDANGNPVGKRRLPTEAEVRARLRSEGYSPTEIEIGLAVHRRRPLTAAQRAAAKRMGIWPIPKRWKQRAPTDRPGNAPAPGGARPT